MLFSVKCINIEVKRFIGLASWTRCSPVVSKFDCLCKLCDSPGFNPSILRLAGISAIANELALGKVPATEKWHTGFIYLKRILFRFRTWTCI
jgi:hypothetical protein